MRVTIWLVFFVSVVRAVNGLEEHVCDPEYIFDATFTVIFDQIVDTNFPVVPMEGSRNTLAYRQNAFEWFNETYGIDMDPNDPNDRMVLGGDGMLFISRLPDHIKYKVYGADVQGWPGWRGKFGIGNSYLLDDFFVVIFTSDTMLYGSWGGMAGTMVKAGEAVVYGGYQFMVDDVFQYEVRYDSPCPIMSDPMTGATVINCELFHPELGHGLAFGASKIVPADGGMYHTTARVVWTFPDYRHLIDHDCAKCEFLPQL